jgi:hypothetical protein
MSQKTPKYQRSMNKGCSKIQGNIQVIQQNWSGAKNLKINQNITKKIGTKRNHYSKVRDEKFCTTTLK